MLLARVARAPCPYLSLIPQCHGSPLYLHRFLASPRASFASSSSSSSSSSNPSSKKSLSSRQAKEVWRSPRFSEERERRLELEEREREWERKQKEADKKVPSPSPLRQMLAPIVEKDVDQKDIEDRQKEELRKLAVEKLAKVNRKALVRYPSMQPIDTKLSPVQPFNIRTVLQAYTNSRMRLTEDHKSLILHTDLVMRSLESVALCSRKSYLEKDEAVNLLISDLETVSSHLSIHELCNAAWYLGVLHEFSALSIRGAVDTLLSYITPVLLRQAGDKDIGRLVWMLSKTGVKNPALYESIAQLVASKIHTFSLHNVSLVVWSFSKAKIPAEELFQTVKTKLKLRPLSTEGKEFACLAAAFESRMPEDRNFMAKLANVSESCLSLFNEQSLANVLGSYSIAEMYPERLFKAGMREVMRPNRHFEPRELVKLIITFTNSGLDCPALINHLVDKVQGRLPSLFPNDLVLLIGVLSTNKSLRDPAAFNKAALSALLQSFDSASIGPSILPSLYYLTKVRYHPLPKSLLEQVLDPEANLIPPQSKSHQLMAAGMLNILKRDLRTMLLDSPTTSSSSSSSSSPSPSSLSTSTSSSSSPRNTALLFHNMEPGEASRAMLLNFSTLLSSYASGFSTTESLSGFSPRHVACLAGSFALGNHSREVFFDLWVPHVLENASQSDPRFKESLLLILSSYLLYGVVKGPHFARVVEKVTLVSMDFTGRDLAHLSALVSLFALNAPKVRVKAEEFKSTIDLQFHELLRLSRSHFVSRVPPAPVIEVHKLLLEEMLAEVLQPTVRGLFEDEKPRP